MLISVGTLWRKELLSEVTHAKGYHESDKKDLIAHLLLTPPRQGGNKLLLVVERGEKIVPSLNSAFPKPKEEAVEKPKSYSQEVPALQWSDVDQFFGVHSKFLKPSIPTFAQVLERTGRLPGQKEQGFTTVSIGFVFSLYLFSFVCSGGEGQDGQQAVQLPHGHVQRGHHRGDHDTGTFQSHILLLI